MYGASLMQFSLPKSLVVVFSLCSGWGRRPLARAAALPARSAVLGQCWPRVALKLNILIFFADSDVGVYADFGTSDWTMRNSLHAGLQLERHINTTPSSPFPIRLARL